MFLAAYSHEKGPSVLINGKIDTNVVLIRRHEEKPVQSPISKEFGGISADPRRHAKGKLWDSARCM
jgi:hypothetical protein